MELRQMEHFIAVAEELHFTRAATRVGIVQSGLSSSVRSLERELGVALFERNTRGIELTIAGEALLPNARRAVAAARAGREAVGAVERSHRGRLAVGLSQFVASDVNLAAVLADFCRDHPAIEVRIHHELPDPLLELRLGRLDLVVTPLLDPVDEDLAATIIARDRMALACPPEHPILQRSRVRLIEIEHERFVDLPAHTVTRLIVDRAFGSAGLERQTVVEVDDVGAGLELVGNGIGVAILPARAASLAARGVFRPLEDHLAWNLAVVRRARGAGGPALAELHRRVVAIRPGHGRVDGPLTGKSHSASA